MWQMLLTALLVGGSAGYVLWTLLLPAAVRRRMALALLRWRWPGFVTRRLLAQTKPPSGCHCDGCGDRPAPRPTQPVHWAPRRKR